MDAGPRPSIPAHHLVVAPGPHVVGRARPESAHGGGDRNRLPRQPAIASRLRGGGPVAYSNADRLPRVRPGLACNSSGRCECQQPCEPEGGRSWQSVLQADFTRSGREPSRAALPAQGRLSPDTRVYPSTRDPGRRVDQSGVWCSGRQSTGERRVGRECVPDLRELGPRENVLVAVARNGRSLEDDQSDTTDEQDAVPRREWAHQAARLQWRKARARPARDRRGPGVLSVPLRAPYCSPDSRGDSCSKRTSDIVRQSELLCRDLQHVQPFAPEA